MRRTATPSRPEWGVCKGEEDEEEGRYSCLARTLTMGVGMLPHKSVDIKYVAMQEVPAALGFSTQPPSFTSARTAPAHSGHAHAAGTTGTMVTSNDAHENGPTSSAHPRKERGDDDDEMGPRATTRNVDVPFTTGAPGCSMDTADTNKVPSGSTTQWVRFTKSRSVMKRDGVVYRAYSTDVCTMAGSTTPQATPKTNLSLPKSRQQLCKHNKPLHVEFWADTCGHTVAAGSRYITNLRVYILHLSSRAEGLVVLLPKGHIAQDIENGPCEAHTHTHNNNNNSTQQHTNESVSMIRLSQPQVSELSATQQLPGHTAAGRPSSTAAHANPQERTLPGMG